MKRILALLMCVLLFVAIAGCASKTLTKVTVNEVTHSVFYAPQYAAMALGYFKDEGLEIDLVNGGGSDKSMTAVLAGQADIGLMGPETAVYVYNEGKEDHAVIIGQLTKRDGSFLVGRQPVADFKWESLAGTTVIAGRKGGMPQMTLEHVLKAHGLTPGENINVLTHIQFNLMGGAFEGGEGDYVTLFEPTASLFEKEGKGYILAAVGAASGEVPYTAYMVKKSSLKEKGDLYKRYMRAVAKAQTWVNKSDPELIAKTIAPYFPDSDVAILTMVAKRYKDFDAWMTTPVMEKDAYERLQDIMTEAGVLEKRAPYEAVVDNTIAKAVSK